MCDSGSLSAPTVMHCGAPGATTTSLCDAASHENFWFSTWWCVGLSHASVPILGQLGPLLSATEKPSAAAIPLSFTMSTPPTPR